MSISPKSRTPGLALFLLAAPATLLAQGALQHWQPGPKALPEPRAFAASAVTQGKLWAIGGEASGAALSSVRILDPKTSVWSPGPTLPKARTRASASVLGTRLFVVGGEVSGQPSTSVLELVGGKWKSLASTKIARSAAALAADSGALYLLGGRSGSSRVAQKSCERFDPVKGSWSALPDMPGPRFGHAVHLAAGKLYVFGGFAGSEAQPLRSTWVYDIVKKT